MSSGWSRHNVPTTKACWKRGGWLTNKLDLPAELVVLGYRYRWTVELVLPLAEMCAGL